MAESRYILRGRLPKEAPKEAKLPDFSFLSKINDNHGDRNCAQCVTELFKVLKLELKPEEVKPIPKEPAKIISYTWIPGANNHMLNTSLRVDGNTEDFLKILAPSLFKEGGRADVRVVKAGEIPPPEVVPGSHESSAPKPVKINLFRTSFSDIVKDLLQYAPENNEIAGNPYCPAGSSFGLILVTLSKTQSQLGHYMIYYMTPAPNRQVSIICPQTAKIFTATNQQFPSELVEGFLQTIHWYPCEPTNGFMSKIKKELSSDERHMDLVSDDFDLLNTGGLISSSRPISSSSSSSSSSPSRPTAPRPSMPVLTPAPSRTRVVVKDKKRIALDHQKKLSNKDSSTESFQKTGNKGGNDYYTHNGLKFPREIELLDIHRQPRPKSMNIGKETSPPFVLMNNGDLIQVFSYRLSGFFLARIDLDGNVLPKKTRSDSNFSLENYDKIQKLIQRQIRLGKEFAKNSKLDPPLLEPKIYDPKGLLSAARSALSAMLIADEENPQTNLRSRQSKRKKDEKNASESSLSFQEEESSSSSTKVKPKKAKTNKKHSKKPEDDAALGLLLLNYAFEAPSAASASIAPAALKTEDPSGLACFDPKLASSRSTLSTTEVSNQKKEDLAARSLSTGLRTSSSNAQAMARVGVFGASQSSPSPRELTASVAGSATPKKSQAQ